jgi:quercetin dioxygenase-like cupin family protein
MKSIVVSLLVTLIAMSSLAQKGKHSAPPSEVEITAEPSHHLAFQNSYVRVFQVEVAPKNATLMHRHRHDYVFVTLGASEVSNEVQGKSPVTLKLQDGETRFTQGNFAHIARNLSTTPFRNVTIELLRDETANSATQKWDEDRGLQVLHGGTQEILFVKDGVRVSEVELQTAGILPKHRHGRPELIVAVTDLLFRNDVVGKPAANIEMKSGDVRWEEAGFTHTVTNVGKEAAKFVTLDF